MMVKGENVAARSPVDKDKFHENWVSAFGEWKPGKFKPGKYYRVNGESIHEDEQVFSVPKRSSADFKIGGVAL